MQRHSISAIPAKVPPLGERDVSDCRDRRCREKRENPSQPERKIKKKIHNKGKISALCSEQSYDNCFDVTWYMFKNLDLIVCYFEQRRVNLNPWHCSMKQVLLIGCVLVLDTEIPLNFLTIQLLKRQKALNK